MSNSLNSVEFPENVDMLGRVVKWSWEFLKKHGLVTETDYRSSCDSHKKSF